MKRVPDAHAAAVVHRYPGRAARRVEKGIENRPVGDRVAAVAHAFGLSIGGRDRASVQMIPTDDDWCLDASGANELIDPQSEPRAIAVPKPQDARRQSLERDPL